MAHNKAVDKHLASLPVVLTGSGCLGCPALRRSRDMDEHLCIAVGGGDVLLNHKTQRGENCPLEDYE